MEGIIRKPFQGTTNIVRFNWHYYVMATAFVVILFVGRRLIPEAGPLFLGIIFLTVAGTCISLFVSFYVYDYSGLYKLEWLKSLKISPGAQLLNFNAGFDETSFLLAKMYPDVNLVVFDFYDPVHHTEISIERARKAHAVYPGTKAISTAAPPLDPGTMDFIFAILSAHEIRNSTERILFFRQLLGSLREGGKMVIVEHFRDLPNFIAYNFGFFHFFPKKEWEHTFHSAGLHIHQELKIAPFISAFILQKDGTTA